MQQSPAARRTVIELAGVELGGRSQRLEVARHARRNRKGHGRTTEHSHIGEVFDRVELRLGLNQVVKRMRGSRAKQQGVAIGSTAPDFHRTQRPAGPRLVLDHHGLPEHL